jgi:hypothetical protein
VTPDRVARDIPPILRGTVGSEVQIRGVRSLPVSGYGIVVGLNGTGSADIPAAVRVEMENELARRGVGQSTQGLGWTTPTRLLNDPNTAVVLVTAVVPAGATAGSEFDVFVTALSGTSTTSLEGGRLWTTDLRRGANAPGGPDTEAVARAGGEIFINPFADPAADGADAIDRRSGRILHGGVVLKDNDLLLTLDNPSHARARSIVAAINTHFPQGSRDRQPTANGLNEEVIQIFVPTRHRQDPDQFIELLLASRIDTTFPQEWARRYSQAMRSEPIFADQLAIRLEAIGDAALPYLRDLYDYTEIVPRLAALRAGARLGDALTSEHLLEIANGDDAPLRAEAIELLSRLGSDPKVNRGLRRLLDADDLEVRIAAYEALAERGDPLLERRVVEGKFILDTMPAKDPLVYITQTGEPRIAILGAGLEIRRPTLVSGWSDRLMLAADEPADDLRVYYLDHRSGRSTQAEIDADLERFIRFLAHRQTPEDPAPGLDLTYSEVVGALHEVWKDDGFAAAFVAEQDKLAAELLNSIKRINISERPETLASDEAGEGAEGLDGVDALGPVQSLSGALDEEGDAGGEPTPTRRRSFVVPLTTGDEQKREEARERARDGGS